MVSFELFQYGAFAKATHELAAIADSCAKAESVDNNYYESFVGPLREFLEYRKNGRIKLIQAATLNFLTSATVSTGWNQHDGRPNKTHCYKGNRAR